MGKRVSTEEELAQAIKNGQDTIEIEGDLGKKIIRIKATGTVAWGVCIGAIGIVVTSLLLTAGTGGAAAPATAVSSLAAAPVLVATLGIPTATSLVALAVASGGIGVLNKLRKYKLVKHNDYITLHKK